MNMPFVHGGRVIVSHRRTCPSCHSKRASIIKFHGNRLVRRYQCSRCDAVFRGMKLLGVRIAV